MARGLATVRWLMLLSVAIPLLAFAGFATWRHQQMHADAQVRLDRSLRVAHEHAMRVLDTNETMLRHLLDLVQTDDDAQLLARSGQLYRQLLQLAENKPQLQSIWVIGPDGSPLASSRFASPPVGLNLADRNFFQWHSARRGGTYFTEPLVGRATKEVFFDMSRERRRSDGSFGGVVSASLFPSYFTELHATLVADEPGLAITMFREDGAVYSRWPALAGPGRMSPSSPVLARVLKGETSGTIRGISSLDGQDRLILFQKLGHYPVYLGTGRDLGAIRSAWLGEMGVIALFGLLPMLGILVTAWVAVRRTRDALAAAEGLRAESLARRQVEDALFQAQKLEALGRLTGGVAHDFNNALMVVSGNLHLLRLAHPEISTRFTDAIARAVESATKLTRQLLAFSRRQALLPETLHLQSRLPALGDLLTPTLGSQVQLSIEVAPDTRPVEVDPAELELAVINLAVNARDAMPEGGSFTLRAMNLPPPAGDSTAPMVAIEAVDSGSGIAPDVVGKVFEPFFTTKPVGQGTGLGLSQVYALCKRAGGDVVIDSLPGQGTTVRMLFPASSASPEPTEARAPEATRSVGKSVLVVEDNDEVAAVIEPVLKGMGCSVVRLENGEAALDWLEANWNTTDIVLTDVVMPGEVDGLALASHVKTQYPSLKVLVMTGYSDQLEAISRLGLDVLPKPFSPQLLAEALERTLRATSA
jgi:signal transduction histidine kinase/CheY-like chemotaxis protein